MAVKTFDPKQFSMIFSGKIIQGFADGTFIKVERNEPAFNTKIGVDGEGTRVKTNNKSGKISIILMQSSSSNDDLSSIAASDELNNTGTGAALVKDPSGRTVCAAQTAWIMKYPDAEFSKDAQTRTWVLESDSLEMFIGGN